MLETFKLMFALSLATVLEYLMWKIENDMAWCRSKDGEGLRTFPPAF
jgi:hypothetical protein